MKEQLDLLDKICCEFYLLQDSFDFLEYIYKFNPDEGWVGTELFVSENGVIKNINLSEASEDKIKSLCDELHKK